MALPTRAEVRPVFLRVISEMGGRARPSDVYPRITEHFPDITPEDLAVDNASGSNRWRNRVQWVRQDFVFMGAIDRSVRGVWQFTAHGHVLAQRAPTADALGQMLRQAQLNPTTTDEALGVDDAEAGSPAGHTQPPIEIVSSESERIITELEAAATDSRDPDRLERVVGDALAFLGFEVEVVGGPGKTDVLAEAPLGVDRYRVVVDAKSTTSGRVADAQIDWLSIRGHREAERADHSLLVGPAFAGGQLKERATEFDTSLIDAAELGEILRVHAVTPISLTELRPLFESVPLARTRIPQIRAEAQDRARRLRLLTRLLKHMDNLNRAAPDVILAKADTLYASIVTQADEETQGTTRDDVQRALALLETIGAVRQANGDGYVSQTSVEGARQMLAALSALPNEAPTLADADRTADSA